MGKPGLESRSISFKKELDPEEILQGEIFNKCVHMGKTLGWKMKPTRPDAMNQNGKEIGQCIIFRENITVRSSKTDIDVAGKFVWVLSLNDNPRELVVVSQNNPTYVDIDQPDWSEKLENSLTLASQDPGIYVNHGTKGTLRFFKSFL